MPQDSKKLRFLKAVAYARLPPAPLTLSDRKRQSKIQRRKNMEEKRRKTRDPETQLRVRAERAARKEAAMENTVEELAMGDFDNLLATSLEPSGRQPGKEALEEPPQARGHDQEEASDVGDSTDLPTASTTLYDTEYTFDTCHSRLSRTKNTNTREVCRALIENSRALNDVDEALCLGWRHTEVTPPTAGKPDLQGTESAIKADSTTVIFAELPPRGGLGDEIDSLDTPKAKNVHKCHRGKRGGVKHKKSAKRTKREPSRS